MNTINSINATLLKYDISNVLDMIYHHKQSMLVERYGKPIAKIVPYQAEENDLELIAEAVVGKIDKNKSSWKNVKSPSVWQHDLRKNEDRHR